MSLPLWDLFLRGRGRGGGLFASHALGPGRSIALGIQFLTLLVGTFCALIHLGGNLADATLATSLPWRYRGHTTTHVLLRVVIACLIAREQNLRLRIV